jgi:hypothetical protein
MAAAVQAGHEDHSGRTERSHVSRIMGSINYMLAYCCPICLICISRNKFATFAGLNVVNMPSCAANI